MHVPRIDPFDSKWALRALYGRFLHTYLPTLGTPNTHVSSSTRRATSELPEPSSREISLPHRGKAVSVFPAFPMIVTAAPSGSRNFETGIVASLTDLFYESPRILPRNAPSRLLYRVSRREISVLGSGTPSLMRRRKVSARGSTDVHGRRE